MEKVKFSKEETKNLLGMLKSTDTENHTIAFTAINNADLTEYFGELLVLYKYAKLNISVWKKECPNAFSIIDNLLDMSKSGVSTGLTSGKCLSIMTENKASKEAIELYVEYFMTDMIGFLEDLGYPTDKFVINIEFKE